MSITESAVDDESYNFENVPLVKVDGIIQTLKSKETTGPQQVRLKADNNHVKEMSQTHERLEIRKSQYAKYLETKPLQEVSKIVMPL